MLKQVLFKGHDEKGNIFCRPLLDTEMVKTASVEDARLHPTIKDFVRTVRPTKHGIYVLVNALGAGEIWGSNVNGDFFPERELIHAPSDWEKLSVEKMQEAGKKWPWGFPTFMGAHPYKHHVNKDPSRAFGRVELAAWNPQMRRVELVVYLDRELCKRFDAYDVIERIERGEFPDVSMGCKVPYDVCSICQHRSKTPKDYCEHARSMMNVILPDGRKVFVYNPRPRFFDISFVFIGADKTAKVMAKLASRGKMVCLGDFCTVPRLSAEVGEMFSKEAGNLEPVLGRIVDTVDGRLPSKLPCNKCHRTDYVDIRAGLCDKCAFHKHAEYGGAEVPTENQTGEEGLNPSYQSDLSSLDPTSGERTRSGIPLWSKSFAARLKKAKEEQERLLYPPAVLETNDESNKQFLKTAAQPVYSDDHVDEMCSCGNRINGCHCKIPNKKRIVIENGCYECRSSMGKTANDPIQKWLHIHHIPVAIEWPKGSVRKYYDKKDPTKVNFEKKMKAHYGYIPGTVDSDGEQLDAYVGSDLKSDFVFIISQLKDDGSHDERKVMLGYPDEAAAKKSYLDHMPPKRLGSIEATTIEKFKKEHLHAAKKARIERDAQTAKTASGACNCHGLGDDCGGSLEKFVEALFPGTQKSASHKKVSELIKSIPAGPFSKETLPKLERAERSIPKDTLTRMGEMDLNQALSTPAMMGMVLKPHEFQRVMLVHIGEKRLADELDEKGEVFGPSSSVDSTLDVNPSRIHHLLQELLCAMGLFRDRSMASTPLSRRVGRLKEDRTDPRKKEVEKTASTSEHKSLLEKLSAAYNGYRRNLIKKAALIENHLVSSPQLLSELFGESMAEAFAGGTVKTSSASVFSPESLAYMMGAFHQDRTLHIADRDVRTSLAQMGALAEAMS